MTAHEEKQIDIIINAVKRFAELEAINQQLKSENEFLRGLVFERKERTK